MNTSADLLRSFVQRIESLREERAAINSDIALVRAEAKAAGFDVPTVNTMVLRREQEPAWLIEADMLLEAYEAALGCGAQAAGQLVMTERADGSFGPAMLSGPASPAAAKLDRKTREFMKLAANAAATAQAVEE